MPNSDAEALAQCGTQAAQDAEALAQCDTQATQDAEALAQCDTQAAQDAETLAQCDTQAAQHPGKDVGEVGLLRVSAYRAIRYLEQLSILRSPIHQVSPLGHLCTCFSPVSPVFA